MKAYADAGGSPALDKSLTSALPKRPDLAKIGDFAGQYGFVMTGGTSASALQVYEAQAKDFTGYWAGQTDLDAALKDITAKMQELLKK
jgi:multiple sugar transport system substrate-binding protein